MQRIVFVLSVFLFPLSTLALNFNFNNEEIAKMVESYSKATKQKFVIDPSVRGKATITAADDVPAEEAFNLLSTALAVNGYAISKQGDTMVIRNARNIQRDLIETSTELPTLKPERMATWVVHLKNVPVELVNREIRIFPSKDGEMSIFQSRNQLIISDYTSNLHRIAAILKEIDIPVDAKVAKVIEAGRRAYRADPGPRKSEPQKNN